MGSDWMRDLAARYFVWKAKRKYVRYKEFRAARAELLRAGQLRSHRVADAAEWRKQAENEKTHTLLRPKDCDCDKVSYCNICDGGLAYCVVCKGGESELEEQSCEERVEEQCRQSAAKG